MANLYPKITKDITALANKFNDMSIYPVNAQDYKDLFFIVRQLGLDVSSLTPSSTTPTLDQVTTAGNTTANTIDVGGVTTDYVQLDTLATPTPAQGMIYWDQDEETAGLQVNGLNYEIGQGLYWVGKNQTGSQINKGTAVYASGTLGASARILIAPMIADGSIDAKYFLGITAENIADGDDGKVITQGKIRQINTTGYGAAGNVLWVSPTTAGALTQTQPTGTDLALAVAFVLDFASNGTMAVRVSTLDENAFTAIPTLDQVTTAGNTTANAISAGTITANNELHLVNSQMRIFRSGDDMRLRTNSLDRVTIASTGNVLIGTTTDSGHKLYVNGDIRVNGRYNPGGAQVGLYATSDLGLTVNTGSGNSFLGYYSTGDTSYTGTTVTLGRLSSVNLNAVSGLQEMVRITGNYAPTSGTGLFTALQLSNTINQTGGANGITRGLYVNPTLTSAADFRAIETTSGNVIFNGGNVGIGTTAPEGPLHVKYSSSTVPGITIENDGVGFNAGSMTLRSGTTGGTNMSVTAGGGMYWYNLDTSSNTLSLPSTGNLIVGGAVDAGFRLDVQGGDARFAQNVEAATYSVAGNAGYSGIVNFPSNPAGSQNLEFLHGILINVF